MAAAAERREAGQEAVVAAVAAAAERREAGQEAVVVAVAAAAFSRKQDRVEEGGARMVVAAPLAKDGPDEGRMAPEIWAAKRAVAAAVTVVEVGMALNGVIVEVEVTMRVVEAGTEAVAAVLVMVATGATLLGVAVVMTEVAVDAIAAAAHSKAKVGADVMVRGGVMVEAVVMGAGVMGWVGVMMELTVVVEAEVVVAGAMEEEGMMGAAVAMVKEVMV